MVYGTLTIENSTISGNSGSSGGGLFNSGGSLTITNSTISGNIGGGLLTASVQLTTSTATITVPGNPHSQP